MRQKKPKKKVLSIRLSPEAHRLLYQLAYHGQRSLSGTVEWLILVGTLDADTHLRCAEK